MNTLKPISRRKFHFLIVFILLIFSGCSRATGLPQSTSTIPVPATSLPPLNEATSTPPASPALQENSRVLIAGECIQIEEKMPDDLVLSGVWVRNEATPYLENLDEHVDYIVPLEGGGLLSTRNGDMAISPDGKHLAYIDAYIDPVRNGTEKRILRIIKSSGHSLQMDYWTEDWQWIMTWIDNRNLAIFTAKKEVTVLNPFTGEFKEFRKPEWLDYDKNYWKLPTYSPKLDWALVYTNGETSLKDVKTGEVLWKTSHGGYSSWSATGSILVVASSEFINVITNGEQVKKFDISNLGIDSASPPNLSPSGQKLVFTTYYPHRFFIFDITQPIIRELCTDEFNFWKEPFWSPDNRFVVQEVYESYFNQYDLLIDTQEMRAYKLTSGQFQHRLVWLAKP